MRAPPDFARLPVALHTGCDMSAYDVLLIGCGFFGVIGLVLIVSGHFAIGFVLVFSGAFVIALLLINPPKTIVIGNNHVRFSIGRFWIQNKVWVEPVSAFESTTLSYNDTEHGTEYIAILQHPSVDRTIILYRGGDNEATRVRNEAARSLKLPVIESTAFSPVVRPTEKIDVPLSQLGQNLHIPITFDRTEPVPRGISWHFDHGVLRLRIRVLQFSIRSVPVGILIIAFWGAIFWAIDPTFAKIVLAIVSVLGAVAILDTARHVIARRCIEITDTEVRFFWDFQLFSLCRRCLTRDQIVSIDRRPDLPRREEVLIVAPGSRIRIRRLDKKTSAWLVQFLQAAIIRGPAVPM